MRLEGVAPERGPAGAMVWVPVAGSDLKNERSAQRGVVRG